MRLAASSLSLVVFLGLNLLPASTMAQAPASNAAAIMEAMNTPKARWIFHHLCIPGNLAARGYKQGDFVQAYFEISRQRWEASLEALAKNDEKAAMTALAPILHSVTDAFWPGRLERNSAGAITQFKDCDGLGSLKGIQDLEGSVFGGPGGKDKDRALEASTQLLRLWKERKPFDEVAAMLRDGPMKLDAEAALRPLPVSKQRIVISRVGDDASYLLSVPVSRLEMRIPFPGLQQQANDGGGAADNPRYFYLGDGHGLNVSGWFEQAGGFKGMDKFWSGEVASWRKQGLAEPLNTDFVKVGNWQAVFYDMPLDNYSNLHVRAHWVQAGTWIDIHLSLTGKPSDESISRARLLELLKSITVREKSAGEE